MAFAAAPCFAGSSPAAPVIFTLSSAPSSPELLPPDPFLDGIVTTSAHTICTKCNIMIIDSCVGQPNHAPCQNNPSCRCEKCNGDFDCYRI